ncbi:hypothetical protein FRC15_002986 [Serendipita sp. 397]|nr:hypothetical protein FRC15_002986 [Serendipita sp. 397]
MLCLHMTENPKWICVLIQNVSCSVRTLLRSECVLACSQPRRVCSNRVTSQGMDEVTSESGITISKADIAEVREVYQKCWDEYYDWEPGYCTSKLRSLEPGNEVSSSKSLLDKLGWAAWDCGLQEWDTEESAASEPFATKTIKIQNEITSEVTEHQIPCYKISVSNFPPVPVYEFCTRLTKCLSSSLDNEEYRHTGNYDEATGQPKMGYTLWIYFCPFVDIDESFPEASRQSFLEASVLSWEDMRNVDNDA